MESVRRSVAPYQDSDPPDAASEQAGQAGRGAEERAAWPSRRPSAVTVPPAVGSELNASIATPRSLSSAGAAAAGPKGPHPQAESPERFDDLHMLCALVASQAERL